MATTQNTSTMLAGSAPESCLNETFAILKVALNRALESMQDPDSDPIGRYPLLWVYAGVTGKNWDQVRTDASERFRRSLTAREIDLFLTVLDIDASAAYRNVLDYFSKFLYCKWTKSSSVRRHKWMAIELALACPESDEEIRRADFQEQLDASIAYLDFEK